MSATSLERAVWQIERGIQWEQSRTGAAALVTVDVLLQVLQEAVAEAGVEDQLEGFHPETLADVLAKAQELRLP